MSVNQEIQEKLASALQLFLSQDQSVRNQVLQFLHNFRTQQPLQYIVCLIFHLANGQTTAQSRTIAAIFLYSALHKQTPDSQRHFVFEWNKVNLPIREQLRLSATQGLTSGEPELQNQCSYLLGLFYAIENYNGNLEASAPTFAEFFCQLIEAAINSPDPKFRSLLYNLFMCFAQNSLELNQFCYRETSLRNLSPKLFEVFLTGMVSDCLPLQKRAIEAFTESFLIFKRYFSFNQNHSRLFAIIFQLIQSAIPDLLIPAYSLLKTCIDCCYDEMTDHMEAIEAITVNDLQSGVPERQVEACFLWSTIAEVENDIQTQDKQLIKMKHREFCLKDGIVFSKWAFNQLFDILVLLICNTNPNETDAHISLDKTPSHAAFLCINSLSKAADIESLPRIYAYVDQNAGSQDWRLRYTSALLLNAASQVKNNNNAKNILIAFEFFVNAIVDPVPRVSEAAMWSLGRLIKEIPELILDPQRFVRLCGNVSQRMNVSDELTSRACWLFNICFTMFSRDDQDSPLVQNFEKFSTLLLECADKFDVNAQFSAFGALDRLIEHTPSTIAEQYNKLFSMVTAKLQFLIMQYQNDNVLNNAKSTQQMIGLLTLVHSIIMNVGPMISNISDQLMAMLNVSLDFQNGNFVCEVLPAMGAVARAIRGDFTKFLPPLIEKVFGYLSQTEYVQPAAVFVADIFNSCPEPSFPDELTNKFVLALFQTLDEETLSPQARIAVFSALANIACYVGGKCIPWIEKYLDLLEKEGKSMLSNSEDVDPSSAKSFAVENLSIYIDLLPIMAQIPKGDRKVRNFFHIFEKIVKSEKLLNELLPDCVILIRKIAETFQRKMNVYLNKPAVLEILKLAKDSDYPNLAKLANDTYITVRNF